MDSPAACAVDESILWSLQTSPITQSPVRYIHNAMPHSQIIHCAIRSPQFCPFRWDPSLTGKNHPWAHPTHYPKRHLDRLFHRSTFPQCTGQTDINRHSVCTNTRIAALAKRRNAAKNVFVHSILVRSAR